MKGAALAGSALLVVLVACSASIGAPSGQAGPVETGAEIFRAACVMCHGADGRSGVAGAKDLTTSNLSRGEMAAVVANGKGAMIGFKGRLTSAQIDLVVEHVRTLHRDQ